MTWRLSWIPLFLVLGYIQLFSMHEKQTLVKEVQLSPTLPITVLKVMSHTYMQQMIADLLFIKTAVFYGGGGYGLKGDNLDVMTNHFLAMQELNPKMIDIYYRTEAALPDKGTEYAEITNAILNAGRSEMPSEVFLPYVEGFNYYYYLDEPIKAAELLRLASTYSGNYQWLGHLASTLEARGGNILAGLTWLKGMHATMDDGPQKERYARDIEDYEKAMLVRVALDRYQQKNQRFPEALSDLIPDELNAIPEISNKFNLIYDGSVLSLKAKDKRKKQGS